MAMIDAALDFLERGICVIPIHPETKRPCVKWREYETRLPTEEEINEWFRIWPSASLAIVTGQISGVVVVDCDNETAQKFAEAEGMRSPIRVKTKHGCHFYFRHPMDGKRRGPRAGSNVRAVNPDWPKIPGLDFRGDGSYALAPPSPNYSWDSPSGFSFDHDMPEWRDWSPTANAYREFESGGGFSFEKLDLTAVNPNAANEFVSEWDLTARYANERFPSGKIPTGQGNGRNQRVLRFASEMVLRGEFGPTLRMSTMAFMREFFEEPLPDREFEATCASVEQMERRNHPERFDASGAYIFKPAARKMAEEVKAADGRKLIFAEDAAQLIAAANHGNYLIEPWLKRGTIVQIHGYSGHGKSLVAQHATYALAAGRRYFGPFEIGAIGRVLYLDYENGQGTIGTRLQDLSSLYGDAGDRLGIWTPFIQGQREMNLNQAAGLDEMEQWIRWYQPDVVVIDTIRSAWSGLEENSASEWAKINRLALILRNAGISVILMHHSNKPGENGLGREAGSSNQLTTLETQLRVTQVFEKEEDAANNAGIFDGKYERPVWPELRSKLPKDALLQMVMELRYGKVREWTSLHDRVQWIGFGADSLTGAPLVVSSSSTKQKAKELALEGVTDPVEIARLLHRPVRDVRAWLGMTP